MGYGLSAAADGKTFPWVFNPPNTYWDGASAIVKYIARRKAADISRARRSATSSLTPAMAASRSRFWSSWPSHGLRAAAVPGPGKEMQNQSSQWLNVRRDRPDYMIMWGWGAMNPTAVKEAAKIRYPMDKFIGIWWSARQ
jgi:branched-chain amino acid transport system substrate-binding protein